MLSPHFDPGLAQTSQDNKSIVVTGTGDWVDTGLDLRPGDQLNFSATGTLNLGQGKSVGPQGQQRGFRDVLKAYPVNEAGLAALIGRVGSEDTAVAFLIGASKRLLSLLRTGRLFLGVEKSKSRKRYNRRNLQRADQFHLARTRTLRHAGGPASSPGNAIDDRPHPPPRAPTSKVMTLATIPISSWSGTKQRVLALFEVGGWVKGGSATEKERS